MNEELKKKAEQYGINTKQTENHTIIRADGDSSDISDHKISVGDLRKALPDDDSILLMFDLDYGYDRGDIDGVNIYYEEVVDKSDYQIKLLIEHREWSDKNRERSANKERERIWKEVCEEKGIKVD